MGQRREHYLSFWADDYAAEADVELVVGGEVLPEHRHVLSMSPVFLNALQLCEDGIILSTQEVGDQVLGNGICSDEKVAKTGENVRLEAVFVGVRKEDVCLLLDHVYSTNAAFNDYDIDGIRRVVVLADRFGFGQLALKCLQYLTGTNSIRENFVSALQGSGTQKLTEWIWVAQRFPCAKPQGYRGKISFRSLLYDSASHE